MAEPVPSTWPKRINPIYLLERSKIAMRQVRKVLMLIENCSVPLDSRVWAEALTLREHGYQVSIIGPKGTNLDQESYVSLDGVHVYRYWSPPSSSGCRGYVV